LVLCELRFTEPFFRVGQRALDRFFRAVAPRLEELSRAHCLDQTQKLPPSIAVFLALRVLRLHSEFLRALPDRMCKLAALQELHLSCPLLEELPEAFEQLRSLAHLSLSKCTEMRALPDNIGALQQMRRLELRHFRGDLPEVCEEWTTLEDVTLVACDNIHMLPPACVELLTRLYLACSWEQEALPVTLPWATALCHLILNYFRIVDNRATPVERLEATAVDSSEPFPEAFFALPALV
ncbi:hypothetical protein CLOM_g4058, partial [Closterium sp. NIES-68]